MDNSKTICPVCTLYLREGVTLQAHLNTHPKDQVIEALLNMSSDKSFDQESEVSTLPSSFTPVQSFPNSNASFIPQPLPYNNPQAQMTTAVTYQHFMTSNGSAIMPQYIQVPTIINPNTNLPVISQEFAPSQGMNYPQTMYNPLYNPYIPHPYPLTQPFYASYPMTALPAVDSNTQTSETPAAVAEENSEAETIAEPSVVVKKCSVATNTELDKRNYKNSVTKKLTSKNKGIFKRVKSFKKLRHSSGNRVIKPSLKNTAGSSTKFSRLKKSVIKTVKTKTRESSSSENSEILSPPPLTPISETPKRSISSSKTPPLPPLSKAPCFASSNVPSFSQGEDVTDSAAESRLNQSSDTVNNVIEYVEPEQKPSTVIVDSSTLMQNSNNDISECKNYMKNYEIQPSGLFLNSMEKKHTEVECIKVLQGNDREENNANANLCNYTEDEDSERQEKMIDVIDIEEDSKVEIREVNINQDIPKEISCENIERNCDGSDIFIQQENIRFNEEIEKEKQNEGIYSLAAEPDNKNQLHENQVSNEFCFYNKELSDGSLESEILRENSFPKPPEFQPVTYTDLQPAKSSRVFQDLGLTSINFNNFMEVDGIKIYFNNPPSAVPFDPLLKLTTGIPTDGRNITPYMKTENPVANHAVVDSVIQVVSGNAEPKNELTFKDYTPTTSHGNDIQLDISNMSPMALNIQADESMPARGELSEQESLGAENSSWNLFHSSNTSNVKSLEEWKSDNSQSVSVIGSKKGERAFKCSICNEVFTCPKERRVHKNTAHLLKSSKIEKIAVVKKPKSYACGFCNEVFANVRDRKAHVAQNHPTETKTKKISLIKEENAEPKCISYDETDAPVKNETEEQNVKTETVPSSAEGESHRVKYCARCSLPFAGVKKLREHLRLVHGEIRFKCETCSACFDEEPEYNDHLLIHPLVCDKCGKKFHKKPNLNLHMKRHLEVKPYECTLCPKSFITRQKLEEHMNGHSGKKPLKCTLCDKTFSRHSNLIQHRNLHHFNVKKKIKDFVCRCGEVFHSLRKLEWHKEVHEPKPKPCPFCSQKFIHSASVTRHIRRAHLPDYLPGDNREYDNVQCPICEKVYLRSSLVVHMRVHNGEKPFACKICNKRFSTKWNLELHSWTHQSRSNMPFKCQICKSAFFRETDFVAHLNSHRNYKPFTCNICGQKFIRKYSCLRHQEEHKKSKQFVCAVNGCAKSFHRGYYLRDHMKVHTGVRPHTCHICGKASSTKSNHNKHIRIHDTREPVNTEN